MALDLAAMDQATDQVAMDQAAMDQTAMDAANMEGSRATEASGGARMCIAHAFSRTSQRGLMEVPLPAVWGYPPRPLTLRWPGARVP